MGFRFTCAVTLSSRSRIAWRNPVFMDSAITNVVTPAATPTTASSVTIRNTAGRLGERKYRSATSHSNVILLHRSFQRPRALQPQLPRYATAGKAPLRGLRGNWLTALRGGRCPLLHQPSAAIHA